MNKKKEYKLESVELAITKACTHRCPYCYVEDETHGQYSHADLDKLCKIVDALDNHAVEVVALVGGDPAEHPQIVALAKYIKTKTKMRISMMSNTLDFNGYRVDEVAPYIDNIDFTLHGRNAEEHDELCKKPGAYSLIMKNLKAYNDLGVEINIAINIIPQTYSIIFDMVKNVVEKEDINVSTLLLQRILPLGRAKDSDIYEVNTEQLNKAFENIVRVERELGIKISVEDPYPLCCIDEKYHKYMNGCPEGRTRMPINGDGGISCCGAVGIYTGGNILTDSYEHIWKNSPLFSEFRNYTYLNHKDCEVCPLIEKCGGGCPIICKTYQAKGADFIKKFSEVS